MLNTGRAVTDLSIIDIIFQSSSERANSSTYSAVLLVSSLQTGHFFAQLSAAFAFLVSDS